MHTKGFAIAQAQFCPTIYFVHCVLQKLAQFKGKMLKKIPDFDVRDESKSRATSGEWLWLTPTCLWRRWPSGFSTTDAF